MCPHAALLERDGGRAAVSTTGGAALGRGEAEAPVKTAALRMRQKAG